MSRHPPTTAAATANGDPKGKKPIAYRGVVMLQGIDEGARREGVPEVLPEPPEPQARPPATAKLPTLREIADGLLKTRWRDTRRYENNRRQVKACLKELRAVKRAQGVQHELTLADISQDDIRAAIELWRFRDRLAPSTINDRLILLRVMGLDTRGLKVRERRAPKWWLRPGQLASLLTWLRGSKDGPFAQALLVADYVEFIANVGLRVEEALRLEWRHVTLDIRRGEGGAVIGNYSELTVPGTKSNRAQASLALPLAGALVLERRAATGDYRVFPIGYRNLREKWEHCRKYLRLEDDPLATLKALRRTAARSLTTNGMPAPILQQYLRHSNIQTTMGYLRLVGGYTTEEQRRWL